MCKQQAFNVLVFASLMRTLVNHPIHLAVVSIITVTGLCRQLSMYLLMSSRRRSQVSESFYTAAKQATYFLLCLSTNFLFCAFCNDCVDLIALHSWEEEK